MCADLCLRMAKQHMYIVASYCTYIFTGIARRIGTWEAGIDASFTCLSPGLGTNDEQAKPACSTQQSGCFLVCFLRRFCGAT